MEATDVLKLRVVLDDVNNLNLAYEFRFQFQDPELDNALCNLVNIEALPSKATIKIVRFAEIDLSSTSTNDTVLLSDNTDSPERLCRWPEIFVVPTFSYELSKREGNSAFVREGKTVRLTWNQKHNILDVLAAEIYKHKAYPSTKLIGQAAEALVRYEGWQNSLRFKMGNYRTKLSRAGIKDVAVNAGKRNRTNPDAAASRANIKRPREGEANFLPNYPHGETKDTLETKRLEMVEQFKRISIERDMILIYQYMQHTFELSPSETAALAGLPLYLKEDSSELFKTCKVFLCSPFPISIAQCLHPFCKEKSLMNIKIAFYLLLGTPVVKTI
uniref:Uncharacterized protein n=1 Tax=Seriola lalandi dorsalis TaxID=1841481 RepID=A0A3B4YGN7_SERLL